MSVAGMLEAMRSRRFPAERLVWMCLENHANGERFWAMTEREIGQELHLSRNTVDRAVEALQAAGILRAERRRRLPTIFHMLLDYAKANGQHPPRKGKLTPHDGASTVAHHGELTPHDGASTEELIPHSGASIVELTPHDGASHPSSNPELTPHDGASHPYKKPTSKKERKEGPHNPPKAGDEIDRPSLFDVFWSLYPRKVGKRTAEAAFNAAVNRGNSAEGIVDGLRGQMFAADPQFIPHPTTWLRGDRWLDEADGFDPVLRAAGLSPEDFRKPGGLLQ